MGRRTTTIIILTAFILCICHLSKSNSGRFLGTQSRFGSSSCYDSYFICNISGTVIRWEVDGVNAGEHVISSGLPERGNFKNLSMLNVIFTSMVLSVVHGESKTNVSAILIVTHNSSQFHQTVKCRANPNTTITLHTSAGSLDPTNVTSNSVAAKHPINMNGLLLPGYATQVLLCKAISGTRISWLSDRGSVTTFTSDDSAGTIDLQRHQSNQDLAFWKALLVESNAEELITMIVWTDFDRVNNFTLDCQGIDDKVSVRIEVESESSSIVSTKSQDSSEERLSSSHPPNIAAGYMPLSPDWIFNIFSVGIALIVAAAASQIHS